jgi:hypothetical protein
MATTREPATTATTATAGQRVPFTRPGPSALQTTLVMAVLIGVAQPRRQASWDGARVGTAGR